MSDVPNPNQPDPNQPDDDESEDDDQDSDGTPPAGEQGAEGDADGKPRSA